MEELTIQQKTYDMIQYGYTALRQFPKSEKFGMAADIKNSMHKILELIIVANKKYYKKTTLQELDVEVAKLKVFIRLAKDMQFLPLKKYEIWSKLIVEIGKMVGGWIKSSDK